VPAKLTGLVTLTFGVPLIPTFPVIGTVLDTLTFGVPLMFTLPETVVDPMTGTGFSEVLVT